MAAYDVLLIDDDHKLYELLDEYLSGYDIDLTWASDGPSGIELLGRRAFDCILLDYMMPEMDGLEVIRHVRQRRDVPIIMLTARGDDADRIVGLEMGADDYVTKPFNARELLARLRAVLRRTSKELVSDVITIRDVEIDVGARTVRRDGVPIDLTAIEFDILTALSRRPGRVVSRESILRTAGRDDVYVGDRTVDVHISHLRKKLGDGSDELIKTVRGVGYVMAKD